MKTVIDIKGAKRFKKNPGQNSIALSNAGDTINSSDGFDVAKVKEDFRK